MYYLALSRSVFLTVACPDKMPQGLVKSMAKRYDWDEKKEKTFQPWYNTQRDKDERNVLKGSPLADATNKFGRPFDLLNRLLPGQPPPTEEERFTLFFLFCPEIIGCKSSLAYVMEVDKLIHAYMESIKYSQGGSLQLLANTRLLPKDIKKLLAEIKTPQDVQMFPFPPERRKWSLWLSLFMFYLAVCEVCEVTSGNEASKIGIYRQLLFDKDKKTFVKRFQGKITKAVRRKGKERGEKNMNWFIKQWYDVYNPGKGDEKNYPVAEKKEDVDLSVKWRRWKRCMVSENFIEPMFLESLCKVYFPLMCPPQHAKDEMLFANFCLIISWIALSTYIFDGLNKDTPGFHTTKDKYFSPFLKRNDFKYAKSKFDKYVSFVNKIIAQKASVN